MTRGVRVGEVDSVPKSPVQSLYGDLTAIVRFLELAAKPKTYWLAHSYWNQTGVLISDWGPEQDDIKFGTDASRARLVHHFRSTRDYRRHREIAPDVSE